MSITHLCYQLPQMPPRRANNNNGNENENNNNNNDTNAAI
jgi:hypothetical protein